QSKGSMILYKCPGAKTLLSRSVVQFGIDPVFDTLILTHKYNYRSVPLWSTDEVIARRAKCSARTACRWRWSHGWYK
ncbi:hypothetical protein, partial [Streptococcus pneumoniae]|uniref:hypothetical protein n=1 Tax=Streptococcus pneumoniae TaxID=1313 RepID=UPI001E562647